MPAKDPTIRLIHDTLRPVNKLDLLGGTANTSISYGAFSVSERQEAALVHLRFASTAAITVDLGTTTGNRTGSYKLADFPAFALQPLASRIKLTASLDAGTATYDMAEVGLGSVTATGNVAVLSGTATFEDIATGTAGSAITAGASVATDIVAAPTTAGVIFDGRSSSTDIFLNVAGALGVANADLVIASGMTVDVWGLVIGA